VQVNGGLATLGRINPDVQKAVMNAGVPIADLIGKNKAWFGESSTDTLWNYSIEKLIRDKGGSAEEQLIVDGQVQWFGVMRGALQEALAQTLPKDEKMKLQFGKQLVGISSLGEDGAHCEFSDGTTDGNFDLVVGCDGVKSAVKEYIEKGKISPDPSKREGNAAAIYAGIRIAYAVQDGDLSEGVKDKLAVEQTFADGAYVFKGTFGNGPNRAPCNCIFIISMDKDHNGPFGKKKTVSSQVEAAAENADWSQDAKKTNDESRKQMLDQLAATGVGNEQIISTVSKADRFFNLGVYFHNPFSLAGWTKDIPLSGGSFAVLCGDAAHAMPPFLGQGANQSIQDAYCLAQRIRAYNSQLDTEHEQDLKPLLKEYETARWKVTTYITAQAAILGYLETGGPNGFYAKFRDVFFKTLVLLGVPVKVLMDSATPKLD
jgi:salicylate hydroxylase